MHWAFEVGMTLAGVIAFLCVFTLYCSWLEESKIQHRREEEDRHSRLGATAWDVRLTPHGLDSLTDKRGRRP